MTSSGKIRIYELSKDLGLENKDVLDAAKKLSIAAKSHSSSISDEEATKIRGVLSKGKYNTDHKIKINDRILLNAGSASDYVGSPNNLNPEQALAAAISKHISQLMVKLIVLEMLFY